MAQKKNQIKEAINCIHLKISEIAIDFLNFTLNQERELNQFKQDYWSDLYAAHNCKEPVNGFCTQSQHWELEQEKEDFQYQQEYDIPERDFTNKMEYERCLEDPQWGELDFDDWKSAKKREQKELDSFAQENLDELTEDDSYEENEHYGTEAKENYKSFENFTVPPEDELKIHKAKASEANYYMWKYKISGSNPSAYGTSGTFETNSYKEEWEMKNYQDHFKRLEKFKEEQNIEKMEKILSLKSEIVNLFDENNIIIPKINGNTSKEYYKIDAHILQELKEKAESTLFTIFNYYFEDPKNPTVDSGF